MRFAYGERDCCLWVADAVGVMTGVDIAAEFRGRYHSRAEAMTVCEQYTGRRSVMRLVWTALNQQGFSLLPKINLAQRGDVVLVRRANDYSLGIIGMSGDEILALAEQSFLRLPLNLAIFAWRV
jgi:hypothetical protein